MSVYTKQSEVEVGQVWEVRWHDGSIVEVEITGLQRYPVLSRGGRTTGTKTRYSARNLSTGRNVTIKSAAKLRRRVR